MYCSKCGKEIPSGAAYCPDCGPDNAPETEKKSLFRMPGKGSKSYAALVTAFMVFPASICVAIDVAFDRYDYWFGYVVGALIVAWVVTVLPVLKVTPPVVTALICFGSIIGSTYYLMSKTDMFNWLPEFVLPLFILAAAFVALDISLIGGGKIKGLHIFSMLALECAAFLVSWEVAWDNFRRGTIDLQWSLILACGFISVIAVIEAFNYVFKINKK
jgi:hypothetical protein